MFVDKKGRRNVFKLDFLSVTAHTAYVTLCCLGTTEEDEEQCQQVGLEDSTKHFLYCCFLNHSTCMFKIL